MHTDIPNHEPVAVHDELRHMQPIRPSMGSWLIYGLGTENQNLPGFVVHVPRQAGGRPATLEQQLPARHLPGHHINNSNLDPQRVHRAISPTATCGRAPQREQLDLLQQLNELHLQQRGGSDDAAGSPHPVAGDGLPHADRGPGRFDLSRETAADARAVRQRPVRRRLPAGPPAGRARRARRADLLPATASRGTITATSPITATTPRTVDQPIAALLTDLKQRGLLDDTLVLWGGEFGRTPTSRRARKGRDHNNRGFTVWLAGGGVKGGMAYGATDEFGFTAVENRVHVHDLHATILHLMGIDHERLTYRYSGRDFRLTDVSGRVIQEIIR